MTRPRDAAVALLAILALTAGAAGCGRGGLFLTSSAAHKPTSCTVQLTAPPGAVAVLVHRASASSRAELKAILRTAEPNEHFFIFTAAIGQLAGSFTTPPGPALPGPAPPPPLPTDPTQVQTHAYGQQAARYDATLQRDRARLHLRWLTRLATWANYVMTALPRHKKGPYLKTEALGLVRGLTAAGASITSLNNIPGIHLGTRIVVAVLGLDRVPTGAPPPLPGGLHGATIVVAGFTGNSSQEATWRAAWTRGGARKTMLLTPSTDNELPAVAGPVLNEAGQPTGHHQQEGCRLEDTQAPGS